MLVVCWIADSGVEYVVVSCCNSGSCGVVVVEVLLCGRDCDCDCCDDVGCVSSYSSQIESIKDDCDCEADIAVLVVVVGC